MALCDLLQSLSIPILFGNTLFSPASKRGIFCCLQALPLTALKAGIHQRLRLPDDFVNHCFCMSHEENNHLYYIQCRPQTVGFSLSYVMGASHVSSG
jgi:hypothetical protein